MTRKEAIEILKAYPLVIKDQQAIQEAIEIAISSLETDEAYQLEYEKPTIIDWNNCHTTETLISLDVYKQVCMERNIAIKQLHELGYEFGEKTSECKAEEKYCDRNICVKNEYNGIGCEDCEVTKSQDGKRR